MNKEKILMAIPQLLIAAMLIYCWTILFTKDASPNWRHYTGLILFFASIALFFKSVGTATVATGVYLLLATFNLLAMTPDITTSWIRIGRVSTPPVQLLSLGLFTLYAILNFNPLVEIYLDYKDVAYKKAQK